MPIRKKIFMAILSVTLLLVIGATFLLWGLSAMAAPADPGTVLPRSDAVGWGYLAAAIATGLSSLSAGYAVAHVGGAAIGAVVEKPELLGRMLILVGLAEGIAIYGLIVSILILSHL